MTAEVEETQSIPLGRDLRKLRREMAERTAMPFACLAVCFVAAPLGARAKRSGRSYTFAVGFGVVLLYYMFFTMTDAEVLMPVPVVTALTWIPNTFFMLTGLVLLWKVDRV